jgi:hypothetical protein
VFSDQILGRPNLAVVQPIILRQFDLRLKAEFRFPVGVVYVHVEPGLLSREEKEPESILAKDCRTQDLFFRHLTYSELPISRLLDIGAYPVVIVLPESSG